MSEGGFLNDIGSLKKRVDLQMLKQERFGESLDACRKVLCGIALEGLDEIRSENREELLGNRYQERNKFPT